MTKWYVTVNENSDHADDPDVRVWTVSRDPDDTGWETDGGFPGYGLTKHDAEELANAANRVKMTEWQPIETAPQRPANFKWEEKLPSFLVWDGKDIYCVEAGLYAKDNGCGCCSSEIKATHWMNLPEPPKQETK